jgi:hypothetical protein
MVESGTRVFMEFESLLKYSSIRTKSVADLEKKCREAIGSRNLGRIWAISKAASAMSSCQQRALTCDRCCMLGVGSTHEVVPKNFPMSMPAAGGVMRRRPRLSNLG